MAYTYTPHVPPAVKAQHVPWTHVEELVNSARFPLGLLAFCTS